MPDSLTIQEHFARQGYASYGWIITRDRLHTAESKENRKGVAGPRNIHPDTLDALKKGKGERFRMLDDDRNVYYEGLFIEVEGREACEGGFEPLDDFGTPDAGCVLIQYRENSKWEYL